MLFKKYKKKNSSFSLQEEVHGILVESQDLLITFP